MKVIQIAHFSHSFNAEYGTPEYDYATYNDWFARLATRMKKIKPDLDVECWGIERKLKEEKKIVRNNILFRIFPTFFSFFFSLEFSLKLILALKKEIKKDKKLIIHLHEYHSFLSYIICLLFKKQKIIAQHHGARNPLNHFHRYKFMYLFYPVLWFLDKIEKKALNNVNVFFVSEDSEKNYLKSFLKKPTIQIQGMGISDDLFNPYNKFSSKKKLGLEGKVVLYIGRLVKNKGIHHLIEAMKNNKSNLIIAGNGDYEEFLKDFAKKMNSNTKFVGFISGDTKKIYFSSADLFVLPSFTEGQPVTVKESIAYNVPVIATNVGGTSYLIENGKNGFLVPVGDVSYLRKKINEALNKNFGNIQKYADKWRWKKIIENTIFQYENC